MFSAAPEVHSAEPCGSDGWRTCAMGRTERALPACVSLRLVHPFGVMPERQWWCNS
jgi:hypothetical protein